MNCFIKITVVIAFYISQMQKMNMTVFYPYREVVPNEFTISFFLDYALDIQKWNGDNVNEYAIQWAEEQFGEKTGPATDHAGLRRFTI